MAETTSSKSGPTLRTLYPEIEPYEKGHLKVSDIHSLYYEQCGNPSGNPVVVLHGGPGGGVVPSYRQFFDSKAYRIILFDQRGAGLSTPSASLEHNTTWDLVEDIERIRKHVGGIEKWVVFGGSWGSTLSLAYAEKYPERVKALILRGIFMLRRKELIWYYQDGASFIFPDLWEEYLAPIPQAERADLMSAYYRRLTSTVESEQETKLQCARAWTKWEMGTSRLFVDKDLLDRGEADEFALTFARIESHFFVHGGWFERDDQILHDAHKIADIPGVIVQGRYDVVCPATSAWDLSKAWKKGELKIIADAGHSAKEPGIVSALVEACDKYKDL